MNHFFAICLSFVAMSCFSGAQAQVQVEAKTKPNSAWKSYDTRTLAQLPPIPADENLDQYGGLATRHAKATGFFYSTKIGERWWLIDPAGNYFFNKGVVSVQVTDTPDAQKALQKKFGDEVNWAIQTKAMLHKLGFNGTGAWTQNEKLQTGTQRPVYTDIWNFMRSYGKKRGGTFSQPGHTGYPNDYIFVFDPQFETFCDEHAKQLASTKDDPYLLGHFSDNELPFKQNALKNYLSLPAAEAGHHAAQKWFIEKHGAQATGKDITPQDESEFFEFVCDHYFRIVSSAIKKYDPNHLFLGSRLHGGALRMPEVFRAAGRYCDVIGVNYYNAWTPDLERMQMWEHEAKKPCLISEWYVKGEDSGMNNTAGAGWIVRAQKERGLFYQNFALALLESKVCVGWHWFKYKDNDPNDKTADPSNTDSNKGIVSGHYKPYVPLQETMQQLNSRIYGLIDYFDKN